MHWIQWVFLAWMVIALVGMCWDNDDMKRFFGWTFAIIFCVLMLTKCSNYFFPKAVSPTYGKSESSKSGKSNECTAGSWWDSDAGPLGNGRYRNRDGKFCRK